MTAPSQRVWLLTSVSLIFLIGASVGVLVDRFLLRPPPPRQEDARPGGGAGLPAGPPVERVMQDLDRALHLTADQRQRVADILNARLPRLRELQTDARERFNTEQQTLHTDISAVLTPEQVKAFDAMAPIAAGPGRGGMMGPGRGGPGGQGRGLGPDGRGRRGGS